MLGAGCGMLGAGCGMLGAGCWVMGDGCGMKKQVQKEKRGNYGSPYFGGGGFCSFENAKVLKCMKYGSA